MEKLAPLGAVYQAGTYSGNPVSVSAGLATLRSLRRRAGHVYPELERRGEELRRGITDLVQSIGLKAQVNGVASMFQIFFTERPVVDYHSAKSSDIHKFQKYFQTLLASRVFIPPSQFETCFLSTVHTPQELEVTLDAVGEALKKTGQM
jgi:glutamate-1-semialdehyde 2,1-aminomutase